MLPAPNARSAGGPFLTLNWGAIASTETDAHVFGGGEVITRFMYGLAGLAALAQIGPWLQHAIRRGFEP
jgi:uncharacterized membrane protein YuzA (DUF378 family)